MLKIRFLRRGKKHQPFFYIVVVDKKRSPKSGKYIERVGFYNPLTKEAGFKKERINYWLSKGVKASDTVFNLLIEKGLLSGKKKAVHKKPKKKEEQGEKKAEIKTEAKTEAEVEEEKESEKGAKETKETKEKGKVEAKIETEEKQAEEKKEGKKEESEENNKENKENKS